MSTVVRDSGQETGAPGTIRPGGRTERCRQAVAEAALALLRRGHTALSPALVAEEAGVARSTVYRRWPTRGDLLREAQTLHTSRLRAPDAGNFAEDVRGLALRLARFFSDPTEIAMNVAMATHTDPDFNDWQVQAWNETTIELSSPFRRAMERGELPREADVASLVQMLVSPMVVQTVLTKRRVTRRDALRLADQVIRLASC